MRRPSRLRHALHAPRLLNASFSRGSLEKSGFRAEFHLRDMDLHGFATVLGHAFTFRRFVDVLSPVDHLLHVLSPSEAEELYREGVSAKIAGGPCSKKRCFFAVLTLEKSNLLQHQVQKHNKHNKHIYIVKTYIAINEINRSRMIKVDMYYMCIYLIFASYLFMFQRFQECFLRARHVRWMPWMEMASVSKPRWRGHA